MAISETKKKIVIDNYFKEKCNVDTSIREAFAKGFEIGLEKGAGLRAETIEQLSWTPVSKDFPIEEELVEVTILDYSGDSVIRYTEVGWQYNGVWIINNKINDQVVAWKPLSKAYEGDC
jgi:hypothetical protein